jgi:hypothetical protein
MVQVNLNQALKFITFLQDGVDWMVEIAVGETVNSIQENFKNEDATRDMPSPEDIREFLSENWKVLNERVIGIGELNGARKSPAGGLAGDTKRKTAVVNSAHEEGNRVSLGDEENFLIERPKIFERINGKAEMVTNDGTQRSYLRCLTQGFHLRYKGQYWEAAKRIDGMDLVVSGFILAAMTIKEKIIQELVKHL